MPNKKVLIICSSTHHGNTLKIAKAIAKVFNTEVRKPSEVDLGRIGDFDLIGFGSGIYNGKHHQSLFDLLNKLSPQNKKKAFLFSTSSIRYHELHSPLKKALQEKGFTIIDEFFCKGFMNYSFIKFFFGGINKKRPNEHDLQAAEAFARKLKAESR
jgi:flavodoxin